MNEMVSKHILGSNGLPMPKTGAVSFDAGSSTSHELSGWQPTLEHPDVEIGRGRDTRTARTRDLIYNNAWMNGGIRRHVDDAIGAQLKLSARLDYKALNVSREWALNAADIFEREFHAWAYDPRNLCDSTGTTNFVGQMRTAFESLLKDGEVIALCRFGNRPGTKYRTSIEIVNADRLRNPIGRANGKLPNGNYLRNGIELDQKNRRVAFHFINNNPGEYRFDSVRIPKATSWGRPNVVHYFERQMADQTRGIGLGVSALSKLKMLDRYERTELEALLVKATLVACFESPMDQSFLNDQAEINQNGMSAYQQHRSGFHNKKRYKINGVEIPQLFPGEKLSFNTAAGPSGNFSDFEAAVLRYVAAGLGQSYEQLTQDWTKTNYSSARAALLQSWKFLTARRDLFVQGFVNQIWALWVEDALSLGVLKLPEGAVRFWDNPAAWCACKWIGPGRGWVDPVKEQTASRMRVEDGISTLRDECAELGGADWQEVLDQRAREIEYAKSIGLENQPSQLGHNGGPPMDDQEEDEEDTPETASDRISRLEAWALRARGMSEERIGLMQ